LGRLDARGVRFITVRQRGAAVVARLRGLPVSAWTKAVIDTPKRFRKDIRYVEERVRLSGYQGLARQVAVEGLGKEKPTLLLTNDLEETARNLVLRYAGRNRSEDGLGSAVDFFHLDRLSSAVRLNVDLDAALTAVAHGCYPWLGSRLKGWKKSKPKDLCRRFAEAAGLVEVTEDGVTVRFDRRSHNPVLRAAARDRDPVIVPWLGDRRLRFEFD
jgi:hypothetical protein